MRKIWITAGVVAALFVVVIVAGDALSLASLQASQAQLTARYAASPFAFIAVFSLLYIGATALSLPGATLLTLVAGAVFGFGWGLVIVSFASTIGATLAMLSARYLLRDWVEARWGSRLASLQAGLEKDGAFYLFSLRLLPIVPFFLLNLSMGLTRIKLWTFFWVSQVGMLIGTMAYVNAGKHLAAITDVSDLLSPVVSGSLVILAFLPFLLRWALTRWQRRQLYARWKSQRPKTFDRNLIVIGGGAAGLVSAYIGAAVKAKVTLIEAKEMGGDCLNFGCVPSKALIKSAKVASQMRHASVYGLADVAPEFSFKAVMARVHAVISAIAPHDSVARYTALGVEVIKGHAQLINPWTVCITHPDGRLQHLTTRSTVIAAGAKPFIPPLPGIETVGCLTSDTLWDAFAAMETIPKRIVVLGGGPIGCELAQSFARLGASVTQVEMGSRLLVREDADVSEVVAGALTADGVTVLTGHKALRCEQDGGEGAESGADSREKWLVVEAERTEQTEKSEQGVETKRIPFDALICAVGRVARLSDYGLETLGIPTHRTVDTNDYLQTIYPNIYAAGDVAGPYQFTHTASHQAWYATVNALFGDLKMFKTDYRVIPWVTFVDPEVARVGLNEQEATAQGVAHEVTRYPLDDLDRAIADSETMGFVKVLTAKGSDRILGVTIVGGQAGELIAEYVLAMKHGLGLNKILATIHTYPTRAEANKYAAGAWKRAHVSPRLLQWAGRYHDWRRG